MVPNHSLSMATLPYWSKCQRAVTSASVHMALETLTFGLLSFHQWQSPSVTRTACLTAPCRPSFFTVSIFQTFITALWHLFLKKFTRVLTKAHTMYYCGELASPVEHDMLGYHSFVFTKDSHFASPASLIFAEFIPSYITVVLGCMSRSSFCFETWSHYAVQTSLEFSMYNRMALNSAS